LILDLQLLCLEGELLPLELELRLIVRDLRLHLGLGQCILLLLESSHLILTLCRSRRDNPSLEGNGIRVPKLPETNKIRGELFAEAPPDPLISGVEDLRTLGSGDRCTDGTCI